MIETIGRRIRRLRTESGLNAVQVAEAIGCHPNSIYSWESDRVVPNGYMMAQLSVFFKVSMTYLATGTLDEPFSSDVSSHIGVPALLEQLGECCADLTKVVLVESRRLRRENPSTESELNCHNDILEKIAAVELCLDELKAAGPWIDPYILNNLKVSKAISWRQRIGIDVSQN